MNPLPETTPKSVELQLNVLHKGLPYEIYAATEGLRSSDLKLLKISPAHYCERQEQKASEAMEFGSLFHKAIENPVAFRDHMKVEPEGDKRTREVKDAITRFREDLRSTDIVVKAKWVDPLLGMLQRIQQHPLASSMLRSGVSETSLRTGDDETGVILKCRPDFITAEGFMLDLKTTRDASEGGFTKSIYGNRRGDLWYGIQAGHYSHCARISKVCRGDAFVFIAVESEPPFGVNVFTLGEQALAPCEQWRSKLTKQFFECSRDNKWPCYSESAVNVVAPEWSVPEFGE